MEGNAARVGELNGELHFGSRRDELRGKRQRRSGKALDEARWTSFGIVFCDA